MLEGYTNADMAGDTDFGRSTLEYLMPSARGSVSWQSKLQNTSRKVLILWCMRSGFIGAEKLLDIPP